MMIMINPFAHVINFDRPRGFVLFLWALTSTTRCSAIRELRLLSASRRTTHCLEVFVSTVSCYRLAGYVAVYDPSSHYL